MLASAEALFEVVSSGAVRIEVNQTYPLKDGAEAHRAIGERRTTGSTVLLPEGREWGRSSIPPRMRPKTRNRTGSGAP